MKSGDLLQWSRPHLVYCNNTPDFPWRVYEIDPTVFHLNKQPMVNQY